METLFLKISRITLKVSLIPFWWSFCFVAFIIYIYLKHLYSASGVRRPFRFSEIHILMKIQRPISLCVKSSQSIAVAKQKLSVSKQPSCFRGADNTSDKMFARTKFQLMAVKRGKIINTYIYMCIDTYLRVCAWRGHDENARRKRPRSNRVHNASGLLPANVWPTNSQCR